MPDLLTSLSFDQAVLNFGIRTENALRETDDEGKPVHTLDNLLDIERSAAELRQMTRESLAILDAEGRHPQWSRIRVDD